MKYVVRFAVILMVLFWSKVLFAAVDDEEAKSRLSQCCSENDFSAECSEMCTYETEGMAVTRYAECFNDLKRWVYCANDGQTNAACCKSKGVPTICRDTFCNGVVPSGYDLANNMAYMKCVQHVNDILACHKENLPEAKTWEAHHFPADAPGTNALMEALAEKRKGK